MSYIFPDWDFADVKITDQQRFVSIWDMLQFAPHPSLAAMSYIGGLIGRWKILTQLDGQIRPVVLEFNEKVGFMHAVRSIQHVAELLVMPVTAELIAAYHERTVKTLGVAGPIGNQRLLELVTFGEMLLNNFAIEAKGRVFFALQHGHAQYMSPVTPHFGKDVVDAFPKAAIEIEDAGQCRATGLWTATVMHLMRATEFALAELSQYLGVDAGQNWNTALNQIDSKLKERSKSTHGPEEEQWAAETSAHIRAIKNAWRNHAQHAGSRYDEREAVAIWGNVQSLLQTLAPKILATAD